MTAVVWPVRSPLFPMILVGALSLSLGWGIRGNFGHAYGALFPGALAAIAVVLVSGREDWWRRIGYFGLFGALGWSFGGTISYMHVIAYTHSGHFPSQGYGFACLFVIGFTWAALGGAGTALPACLDRDRLTGLFPPLLAVLGAWVLQDLTVPLLVPMVSSQQRHESILYWYDTSWLAALVAIVAVLAWIAIRRQVCWGSSFILHLAVGWWVGFLFVVFMVDGLGIEFRMTPPRGDNWAGVLGMIAGMFVYCGRARLLPIASAALASGLVGGFGFVAATFLKLIEVKYIPLFLSQAFGESAWQTNWHSILEQTYGLFNGIGIALAMWYLARRLPRVSDGPAAQPWTEVAAVAFVLLGITYLNLVQNVPNWIRTKAIPSELYGLPSRTWFTLAYALLAAAVIGLLVRHRRHRLVLIPESDLGKGQLLYLVLLWSMVVGNLMRAIPPFQEQRLITEGVIHVNAVLCMMLVLICARASSWPDREKERISARSLRNAVAAGLVTLLATVGVASFGTRMIHGSNYILHAGYHTRFGPDAKTGPPQQGQPHP
jgi:hypothetical protein